MQMIGNEVVKNATNKKKVVFFHNTLAEYRIEFWNHLNSMVELTVAILEPELESEVYGFETRSVKFHRVDVGLNFSNLESLITNADIVVLPPIDDLRCIRATYRIKCICKKKGIAFIFWTEKWEAPIDKTPLKKRVKNIIQRQLFKKCSSGSACYIASGTKAKKYLEKIGVPKEKIKIAIDSSTSLISKRIDIRNKYRIPSDRKIILYFGRLVKRKGCDVLIRACRDNLNAWNAVLLICGDGDLYDECKCLAGDNEYIVFAGKIQPRERKSYYEQSDLFILPSVIVDGVVEGWGLAVNEALECGTPVVVTDAVGAGEDIVNDQNGVIIPNNSTRELESAITSLLGNHFSRKQIMKDACNFSTETMAEAFGDAIYRLL